MNEPTSFDDIDQLLRTKLRTLPKVAPPSNLASVAISKAKSSEQLMAKMARVQQINWWFTTLAAMVIVAVSVWIVQSRLAAGGFALWGASSETTATTAVSSVTAFDWMFITAAMAIGAIVVAAAQRALSAADQWPGAESIQFGM